MLLSSVDWALRGGTVALVLLIAATLLRDYGGLLAARLTALFAVGTGAYAITSVGRLLAPARPLDRPAAGAVGRQQRGVLDADGRPCSTTASACAGGTGRCGCCWSWRALAGCFLSSRAARHRPHAELLRLRRAGDGAGGGVVARRPGRRPAALAPLRGRCLVALYRRDGHGPARRPPSGLAPEGTSLAGAIGMFVIAGIAAWSLLGVGRKQSLFAATDLPRPVEEPVRRPSSPATSSSSPGWSSS